MYRAGGLEATTPSLCPEIGGGAMHGCIPA